MTEWRWPLDVALKSASLLLYNEPYASMNQTKQTRQAASRAKIVSREEKGIVRALDLSCPYTAEVTNPSDRLSASNKGDCLIRTNFSHGPDSMHGPEQTCRGHHVQIRRPLSDLESF